MNEQSNPNEVAQDFEEAARDFDDVTRNFSEALIAAYRMSGQPDLSYQRADPELTRRFCSEVIRYLDLREAYTLASQGQLEGDQEPIEIREQASVGTCIDFLIAAVDGLKVAAVDTSRRQHD